MDYHTLYAIMALISFASMTLAVKIKTARLMFAAIGALLISAPADYFFNWEEGTSAYLLVLMALASALTIVAMKERSAT